MSQMGTFLGRTGVKFERSLPGTVARVWRHLTTPQHLAGWLAAAEIEPKVDGSVTLQFDDRHSARGRITDWAPPHRFAFSWHEHGPESQVIFELEPWEDSVRLRLVHIELDASEQRGVAAGWHAHLDSLERLVKTGVSDSREAHLEAFCRLRPLYA